MSIENFDEIIQIDPEKKLVTVEPRITFEKLVQALLPYRLMPAVVPEFKGITVGGAYSGSSLESSSLRYGQFSDTVVSLDVLLGSGDSLTVSPEEHSDLFWGLSGSFGTLGLITALTLKLIEAKPSVTLTLERPGFFQETFVFPSKRVLVGGELSDQLASPEPSDWFYKTIQNRDPNSSFTLSLTDYLFRHDRGAYWMAAQLFLPKSLTSQTLYRWLHNLPRVLFEPHFIVQDFYLPEKALEEFLSLIPLRPLWLCPIKGTHKPELFAPHYGGDSFVNVGVYSFLPFQAIKLTKKLESACTRLKGRKMLYSYNYFSPEEFWSIYPKQAYEALRTKYHAGYIFPSIEEKLKITN